MATRFSIVAKKRFDATPFGVQADGYVHRFAVLGSWLSRWPGPGDPEVFPDELELWRGFASNAEDALGRALLGNRTSMEGAVIRSALKALERSRHRFLLIHRHSKEKVP